MFRAIFFDLGNVILPFDPQVLAGKLAVQSSYSEKEILDLLWHPEWSASFEKGQIEPKKFFELVRERCQLRVTYEEFIGAFNEIFREDAEVVRLLSKLKAHYPIGLISNTNVAHMDHIRKTFSFISYIDELVLSHEVGIRKPDPGIYWLALKRFGIFPHQAIFIDDNEENVKAADKIGIKAIQFESAGRLAENLLGLGVIA